MRKWILPIAIVLFTNQACSSAKDSVYNEILTTKNISLIENFLANSKTDDPRRGILKPRLIALKNAKLLQDADKARKLIVKPIFKELPKNAAEAEEFKALISQGSSANHQEKTVKLLNALFDQDISSKETILMIQNKSDCNMILRLEGKAFFNLAVANHSENSIVIPKGEYSLSSNLCDVKYNAQKSITKNLLVVLDTPVLQKITNGTSTDSKAQK